MAAIGPRLFVLLAMTCVGALADPPQDVLRAANQVTTGLADNDAKASMDAFDSSFADYGTLASYFQNLTASYYITNEADVVSEEDGPIETKLVLDWTLTLRSQGTDDTVQRRRQVNVVLKRKNNRWMIVGFSPIGLFDPQNAAAK